MSILDAIILDKISEVEKIKKVMSLEFFTIGPFLETRDFKSRLAGEHISIIAEMKKQSPSAGLIREDFDPVSIAKTYEKSGAEAISILTDEKYFGGKGIHVTWVRQCVNLPILRKEFIIDELQIYESRYLGADAVLLIAKVLSRDALKSYIGLAHHLDMDCLVEVHSEADLEKSLCAHAEIIGINNRDLNTFHVDMATSLSLKKKIPSGIITVSESGIRTREDVRKLEDAGFHAILVGETLMREERIEDKLFELRGH
ncbi:indole-3-glycerol phosphate synthase TrpC [bacterium]|nr:indole-3-glycerol phosphate synthase TrpC [bacterium]